MKNKTELLHHLHHGESMVMNETTNAVPRPPRWSLTMDLRGVSLYDPTVPATPSHAVRFIRPRARGRLGSRPRSTRSRPAARRGRRTKAADGDPPPAVRASAFFRAPLRRVTEVSP